MFACSRNSPESNPKSQSAGPKLFLGVPPPFPAGPCRRCLRGRERPCRTGPACGPPPARFPPRPSSGALPGLTPLPRSLRSAMRVSPLPALLLLLAGLLRHGGASGESGASRSGGRGAVAAIKRPEEPGSYREPRGCARQQRLLRSFLGCPRCWPLSGGMSAEQSCLRCSRSSLCMVILIFHADEEDHPLFFPPFPPYPLFVFIP